MTTYLISFYTRKNRCCGHEDLHATRGILGSRHTSIASSVRDRKKSSRFEEGFIGVMNARTLSAPSPLCHHMQICMRAGIRGGGTAFYETCWRLIVGHQYAIDRDSLLHTHVCVSYRLKKNERREGCTTDNVQLQNARLIHAQQSIPPLQLRERSFWLVFFFHADFLGMDGPFFSFSVYFPLEVSARDAG